MISSPHSKKDTQNGLFPAGQSKKKRTDSHYLSAWILLCGLQLVVKAHVTIAHFLDDCK